eukprot:Clim_evm29s148 gene=Clim_evmTU29s148
MPGAGGAATGLSEPPCYTLIYPLTEEGFPSEADIKKVFEKGNDREKIYMLNMAITMMLNGEHFSPNMLMLVIRYVLPSKDHTIKKLLLIFWEIVPKYNSDGKLKQEMILVCDAYRKDLQHPNEFIRGSTLRFLCKLKESELLEPLMPAIRACLEHRTAYVRRNAVLAIFTIYQSFDFLIPDAPDLIYEFLQQENDLPSKRNAFMMLVYADQDRAVEYMFSVLDQVPQFGDILQLIMVELIYKVCRQDPTQRARFIRCVYDLLDAPSGAVRYQAATTLATLSSAPTAIKAAATCCIDLVMKESDNNVKLIVMDKLAEFKADHPTIVQELVMDLMKILSAPSLQVREKVLNIALDLLTPKNVESAVKVLRKEMMSTTNTEEYEMASEYRHLLIRALHRCGVQFPKITAHIVPLLMDFLADSGSSASEDVIQFVKEAVERFEAFRKPILEKLLSGFDMIRDGPVFRMALWVLGEYATGVEEIKAVHDAVTAAIGELPIVDTLLKSAEQIDETQPDAPGKDSAQYKTITRVTEEGVYVTETIAVPKYMAAAEESDVKGLRTCFLHGDFFTAAVVSSTLTKLAMRYAQSVGDQIEANRFAAHCMLIMSSILHLGSSGFPSHPIDNDSKDRIIACIKALAKPDARTTDVLTHQTRNVFREYLDKTGIGAHINDVQEIKEVGIDEGVRFPQLKLKDAGGEEADIFELSLSAAVGSAKNADVDTSRLNKVHQLTGFSDPVYAEAYVNVNEYDIALDVLLVNQTQDTLQNLSLELATLGDMKLVEKPSVYTVGPYDFITIKSNIKVSSTDTGIIFGNIVYDVTGSTSDRNVVVLNDIHIDVCDYIHGAECTDEKFRSMWAEFEWENKVAVNTNITDLRQYRDHLLKVTNMASLTPDQAGDDEECEFLAANLYAKSAFGEDALANLSIERGPDGKVVGFVRIRAKTQGIALSLGDKINLNQKLQ